MSELSKLIMGASVGVVWSITFMGTCALIQNTVSRILWGLFLCGILVLGMGRDQMMNLLGFFGFMILIWAACRADQV